MPPAISDAWDMRTLARLATYNLYDCYPVLSKKLKHP